LLSETISFILILCSLSRIQEYKVWCRNLGEMSIYLNKSISLKERRWSRLIMIIWKNWTTWLTQWKNKIEEKLKKQELKSKLLERRLKTKIWRNYNIWNLTLKPNKPNIILNFNRCIKSILLIQERRHKNIAKILKTTKIWPLKLINLIEI
jgi:hypothetical protein